MWDKLNVNYSSTEESSDSSYLYNRPGLLSNSAYSSDGFEGNQQRSGSSFETEEQFVSLPGLKMEPRIYRRGEYETKRRLRRSMNVSSDVSNYQSWPAEKKLSRIASVEALHYEEDFENESTLVGVLGSSKHGKSHRHHSHRSLGDCDSDCDHEKFCKAQIFSSQIRALQQQLENYVTGRAESDATQLKLREDKSILQNRALMLEEQLSEVKRHHDDEVLQLKQNHREERQHLEREARERVEQLRDQMRDMEQNSHQLKSQVPRLTGQLELLKEDKQKLEDKLDSKEAVIGQLELKLAKLEEEKNRLELQHQWKMSSLQSDHNQLLKELELKNSSSSRSSSRQGHVTRGASFGDEGTVGSGEDARVTDLVHKCNLLRTENSRLIEKIHELESSYRYLESQKSLCENCQLPVAASSRPSSNNGRPTQHSGAVGSLESLDLIQGYGQSPLTCPRTPPVKGHSDGNQSMSLAAELEQVFNKPREIDVNEVVKAALEQNKSYQTICFELKQQEQINSDLQNYLSRLLLLIMESNPEILEVK